MQSAPTLAEGRPGLAPEPVPRRWSSSYPFAILVFLAAAIVAFTVMAIVLGWLTQDVFGL